MRRLLILVLLASLLPGAGPAQAQATADQLNRLSLEALTAPPSGGGGYSRHGSARSYHGYSGRGSVRHASHRSYSRRFTRSEASPSRSRHHAARGPRHYGHRHRHHRADRRR